MLNISLFIVIKTIIKCLQCNKAAKDVLVFCVNVVLGSVCRYIMINDINVRLLRTTERRADLHIFKCTKNKRSIEFNLYCMSNC
jgi:hypothetical protein